MASEEQFIPFIDSSMTTLVEAARYTINDTKQLEEDDKQMIY